MFPADLAYLGRWRAVLSEGRVELEFLQSDSLLWVSGQHKLSKILTSEKQQTNRRTKVCVFGVVSQ